MLSGDEQDVAETESVEVLRLAFHLRNGECGAQDARIAREAAVRAVVHAFVGNVERCEQAHRPAEMAARDLLAVAGEVFQRAAG